MAGRREADVVRISIRLTPRGGSDRVDGVEEDELRCRVAAAPVDGAANVSLVRLLARELDLPTSAVRIVAGGAARRKVVAFDGGPGVAALIAARWPGLLRRG